MLIIKELESFSLNLLTNSCSFGDANMLATVASPIAGKLPPPS